MFSDWVRFAVAMSGGLVTGYGLVIMERRARLWRALGIPHGVRADYLLGVINALVAAFVVATLLGRVGEPLSWRTPLAVVIFALKGWFFTSLRETTFDLEDELARGGRLERRSQPR